MSFKELCDQLEDKIISSYEEGVSLADAEKLAAELLVAKLVVSRELKKADLDSRMRKSGLKAIRAAVYLDAATKGDKKPSDVMLQAMVDVDAIVISEQTAYDEAEVEKAYLERTDNTFEQAHVFFRQTSRGQ